MGYIFVADNGSIFMQILVVGSEKHVWMEQSA